MGKSAVSECYVRGKLRFCVCLRPEANVRRYSQLVYIPCEAMPFGRASLSDINTVPNSFAVEPAGPSLSRLLSVVAMRLPPREMADETEHVRGTARQSFSVRLETRRIKGSR